MGMAKNGKKDEDEYAYAETFHLDIISRTMP
jgi:hypothetical protein